MADELDNVFKGAVRELIESGRPDTREDRKTVAGWIKQVCDDTQAKGNLRAKNEYGRHVRYVVTSEDESPEESGSPLCTKDIHAFLGPSTSRGPCPRKDVIAKLAPTTDSAAIREVIERVANEEITTAAEFIFSVTPYVKDHGTNFQETLEKELSYFREIVDDTVDRRVQDEADVMMHTQNDIKNKFTTLTDAMTQRTARIRQRLYEISPKFNWAVDGRDRAKIAKLIIGPKRKEMKTTEDGTANAIEKLKHQVFMRGQWLKKELTRLQEESNNLKNFLDEFRRLAAERKRQESHVPRMLAKEKVELDKELNALRKTCKRNLEIINALYVEHQRCIKPQSETSVLCGQ